MRSSWNKIRNIVGLVDLSALGAANAGGSAISAAFWFYLAIVMGPEKYGEIGYLIAIAGIAAVFCMFGSGSALTVHTAKNYNTLWPVILISIGSSVAVSIALFIMLKEPTLVAYLIGYVIFTLGVSDFLGRKMYKKYSVIFLLQKICLVGFSIPLYYVIGPTGVILGAGLSMTIFAVQIIPLLARTRVNFTEFRKNLRFVINEYANSLAHTFSGQLATIITASLLGFELLGNYHLGIQVMSLLSILPSTTMQYTLSQDASGNEISALRKTVIIISIILSIIGVLSAPVLIPIIFPEFTAAIIIIQIMSVSLIPRTFSNMYMSRFLGMEKSGFVLAATLVFLAVQIPMILVLGGMFSIIGITIALLIATICQAGFLFIMYKRYRKKENQRG